MKKTFLLIAALMMTLTGLQAQNSTSSLSTQSPQLFLPLTFYSSVAHDALSLDGDPSEANKALLEVYLTRPDLVQATESELRDDYAAPADEIADKPAPAPLPTVVDVPAPVEPETPNVDVEVTKPNFWTFKGDGSCSSCRTTCRATGIKVVRATTRCSRASRWKPTTTTSRS